MAIILLPNRLCVQVSPVPKQKGGNYNWWLHFSPQQPGSWLQALLLVYKHNAFRMRVLVWVEILLAQQTDGRVCDCVFLFLCSRRRTPAAPTPSTSYASRIRFDFLEFLRTQTGLCLCSVSRTHKTAVAITHHDGDWRSERLESLIGGVSYPSDLVL